MLHFFIYFKKQIVLPYSLTAAIPTPTCHHFSAVPCFSPICFLFSWTLRAPKVKENSLEGVPSFLASFIRTLPPPVAV